MRHALAITMVVAALTGATGARAATSIPDAAMQAVVAVAGHPTQVLCDADVNPSPAGRALAWTVVGRGPMHLMSTTCSDLALPVASFRFADALGTLVREASIAGPARSEACASLAEAIGVYDVLRRFYNVPFFTAQSRFIGAYVLTQIRGVALASYQPEACRWPG